MRINKYQIIRLDRNRHGGGILLYVINSFSWEILPLGLNDLEMICCHLKQDIPLESIVFQFSIVLLLPPLGTSDHYGIQIVPNWKCNADQVHQQQRVIWRYKNADFGRACQLINETDWDSLLPSDDIDLATTNWHNTFIEACISQQTLKKKRNVPWLNKNIIHHIRKRNAAFKATKTSNNLLVNSKYKKLRNKVVMLL